MKRIIEEDAKKIVDNVNFSELENKELLITGATGLIGTYLINSLIACYNSGVKIKKLYIIAHNNLPTYLKNVNDYSWIQVFFGDLCDNEFLESLPNSDYIIQAAGYGQPAQFIKQAEKTIKLNTMVNFTLLEKLNKEGKFLFVSSSGVYNGLEKEKYTENDIGTTNTLHPRACYIEGKRCGEAIVNSYRIKGINAKSIRLSYTYGPGVRWDDQRVLYSFIRKGMTGTINLLDQGKAGRIYCYISDAIEMIWKILLFGEKELYNVGAKEKTTILDIAKVVGSYLNAKIELPSTDDRFIGDAIIERLDITKYESEFGQKDFVKMQDGIARTIEWIKEEYKDNILDKGE